MSQGSAKRLCLEDVTMGTGYPQPPYSSGPGGGGLGSNGGGGNNNGLGSPYIPPKVSPGGAAPGGASGGGIGPPFGNNGGNAAPSVEQELQDILEELTKNPDPSLPELDIEKILGSKEDEGSSPAVGGGAPGAFMHPDEAGTPKCSPPRPSHLEAHLTRSPGFPQVGSPQVGLSPAGAPYPPLSHPSKPVPSPLSASPLSSSSSSSSSQAQSQARSPMLSAALSNRAGSGWRCDMSRSQQLQQLASNSSKHQGPPPPPPPPPPSQPGMPSLGQPPSSAGSSSSWAGPSPPYRGPGDNKLPNSSPHHHQQPFSPAGSSIQSPQSSLISSLAPAPTQGPSPPYRPEKLGSPALAQPPFSPQSTLLPSGNVPPTGGAVQGSQASYLGPGAAGVGATRPSPPYRQQDPKHGSPGMGVSVGVPPQQQQQQQQNGGGGGGSSGMANSQLFKAITASQPTPSSLKLLMQQGQQGPTPTAAAQSAHQPMAPGPMGKGPGGGGGAGGGPDSLSFNNTKPLRHFDPDLSVAGQQQQQQQKMGGPGGLGPPTAAPGATGHGPMGGPAYRGPGMQGTPPTPAANHAHLLQQRMQRALQRVSGPGGMVPICREVSNS